MCDAFIVQAKLAPECLNRGPGNHPRALQFSGVVPAKLAPECLNRGAGIQCRSQRVSERRWAPAAAGATKNISSHA